MNGTNRNDSLVGSGLVDVINGQAGDDFLDGGAGDDRLDGGTGNDEVNGGADNDFLDGGNGNDTVDGGTGNDTIDGDTGNDILTGGSGDDSLDGGNGNDTVAGDEGNDTIEGDTGDDVLDGGAGNDFIDGGNGRDTLTGGTGNDTLEGDTGNDSLDGGDGDDLIDAGTGNDTLIGGIGADTLNGVEGNDSIDGGADNDVINGGGNNDVLTGGTGDDSLEGGNGNDLLNGDEGDDTLSGGGNSDTLNGDVGNDVLEGGSGNDTLNGDDGDDILNGGDGNDLIVGGLGSDTLNGGDGNDSIIVDRDFLSSSLDLESIQRASETANVIDGGAGNDTIVIGDSIATPKSDNQILFGRGDGRDVVELRETLVNADDIDSTSLIFKSGLSPEDVTVDILSPSQPDIVFRIIDTGETLTLDADFGLFLEQLTLSFEDGGFINFANIDIASIIEQTSGNQTVNLSTLVEAEPERVEGIQGTENADDLVGTSGDDVFFSRGLSQEVESILGNGGSDTLILDADDIFAQDSANDSNAHFRIRDFTIDDTSSNDEADVLDIGNFLLGSNLDATNIGNYLYVVSGTFGENRTSIFIDREGQFTDQDRANLTNDPAAGGNGADLFLEFQGLDGTNNLEDITGFADNTIEQFQALIDLGFLDLSNANSEAIERPEIDESAPIIIQGTEGNDSLLGSDNDDLFFSEGLSEGAESIQGNGGSDTLIIEADDAVATDIADDSHAHIRIRDFVIDDVTTNSEADVLDISDLLSGFSISIDNLGDHLHIVSGTFNNNRTSIFIDRDGEFSDEERAALTLDPAAGGQGADLFLEFQGLEENNNFAEITGFADNTFEQLQSLIDLGFLEVA